MDSISAFIFLCGIDNGPRVVTCLSFFCKVEVLWLLKSNELNSISKDVLRDERCPWLINCTTQEHLVNVGLDSYFNMPPHVWRTNQTRGP
jgi:hypothetical protein